MRPEEGISDFARRQTDVSARKNSGCKRPVSPGRVVDEVLSKLT